MLENTYCGYFHLIEALKLPVIEPRVRAEASKAVNSKFLKGDRLLLPMRMAPGKDDVLGHVLLALKHEGTNLAVLAEVLPRLPKDLMQQEVNKHMVPEPLRKAAMLWELFTREELTIDRTFKNPVPLFDPQRYVVGSSKRNRKWGIDCNGIGDLGWCPTIERTPKIEAYLKKDILSDAARWVEEADALMLGRVVEWAYLSETQGTYALESESVSADKSQRFVKLLHRAGDAKALDESYLCDLQNDIVSSVYSQAFSFRTDQNWLSSAHSRSALSVTYVPPSPDVLDDLMKSFLNVVNGWQNDLDPIAAAAAASFGFVYLHPFMDGNGRLSRFLIHRILERSGKLKRGLLLPISAAMKECEAQYLEALTDFSKSAREFWSVVHTGGSPRFEFKFKGSVNMYRYWDATKQAEFVFEMADRALQVHLREEADFLKLFDEVYRKADSRFDVRQSDLQFLVGTVLDMKGTFSKNLRKKFRDRIESEVLDFIELAAREALERREGDQDDADDAEI